MVKKFLINFLLILLVFASLEVISFFKIKKQNDDLKAVVDKISANNIMEDLCQDFFLKI
jgi:hypothetical protein